MNPAHFHLGTNHIPVVGSGGAALLMLWAAARKNDQLKRVSLAGFVLIALVAIPVYLSGKAAEDQVAHLAGVSESIIESHEASAAVTLVALEALGALSVTGLLLGRRSASALKWIAKLALLISLVAGRLAAWTANLGGQVRHSEIRNGTGPSEPAPEPESDDHGGRGRDHR
jgi:uncharacterized membrane protein